MFKFCTYLCISQSLYIGALQKWGTAEQKKKFLLPYTKGDKVGCFALSEPGMLLAVVFQNYCTITVFVHIY